MILRGMVAAVFAIPAAIAGYHLIMNYPSSVCRRCCGVRSVPASARSSSQLRPGHGSPSWHRHVQSWAGQAGTSPSQSPRRRCARDNTSPLRLAHRSLRGLALTSRFIFREGGPGAITVVPGSFGPHSMLEGTFSRGFRHRQDRRFLRAVLSLRWILSTFLSATTDGHVLSLTPPFSPDASGLLMA